MAVNNYETVFIAEPDISNDQVEQLVNKIKQILGSNGGTLTAEDRWGKRRLAYMINGNREGFYSVLTFSAEPTVVSALDHLFNITDSVIRHLTSRVIKRNKKFAPRREKPAGESQRPMRSSSGSSRPRTMTPAPTVAAAAPTSTETPAPTSVETPATEGGQPA